MALALLERAGDFCGEDIWHRVVQLVTNNASMQAYAAGQVVDVLRRGANHESLLCTAACVLGEYGKLAQVRGARRSWFPVFLFAVCVVFLHQGQVS